MLDEALAYAARGWPVFPCRPRSKAPLTEHGFLDASTDQATITAWWSRSPTANIGIATGVACDVLDIDSADYVEGVADLPDCDTDGGPVAVTGAGKWHLYFTPTGVSRRIRFSATCDWLGLGGYVIAPPSVHPCGEAYRWFAPFELELTASPAELVVALRPPAATPPAVASEPSPRRAGWSPAGLIAAVATAPEGERNDRLNWAAHRVGADVAAGRCSRAVADDALAQLGTAAGRAGLDEREIAATIRSALAGRGHR